MARTIIIAAEGTTHFSIEMNPNSRITEPVNTVSMVRSHDRMVLINRHGREILDVDAGDVTTPTNTETLAAGQVAITGASGSIDSITVNGVELLPLDDGVPVPVPFNGTLTQTATDAALIITNNNLHGYTATGTVADIDIDAPVGSGNDPNGYIVVSTTTTLGSTDTPFAGGISKMDVLEPLVAAIIAE